MKSDLGTLHVERLIVHDVPTRLAGTTGSHPILSEIESPLNQQLKNYFRERITTSLASAAFDVAFDPQSASPVPRLVLDYLNGKGQSFVAMSQAIAKHLHAIQTGVNPAGLVTVIQTSISGHKAITILKLEREQGVRVKKITHQRKPTFNVQHLRDLMLTEKTRIFKVGLFVQYGKTFQSIEGVVSDKQRGFMPKIEVADFFLKKFLGCELLEDPDVSTKRFFQATEQFINEKVDDPLLKARYQIALLAELSSTRHDIVAHTFAEQHLDTAHRQPFIDFLSQEGVSAPSIQKDVSLIKTHLARIQMEFKSGLAVLGSPDTFDRHVTMDQLEDGRTHLQIKDHLKQVRGK